MKKIFFLSIILSAVLLSASCTKKETASGPFLKDGVLSVGMEIGYPPMEYYAEDGKTPTGFDVDMAKALARELNVEAEFVDTAWDGIFAGVDTKKYDTIISAVTVTPERLTAFNSTIPYIGNAITMVIRTDSPFSISRPEDIAGKRVTYQTETTADIYSTDLAEKGVIFEAFEYDKVLNCFDELRLNRVDIVVVDSLVAEEYLSRGAGMFKAAYQEKADEKFAIFLKKGNDELTEKLDKALAAIRDSGELAQISQKHFGRDLVSDIN